MTDEPLPDLPLDQVLAINLRRLIRKHQWTHADVAKRMDALGFRNWTANRVAQTVTMRRSLTLIELAGLCAVFGVGLRALMAGDYDIPVTDDEAAQRLPLAFLRDALLGAFDQAKLRKVMEGFTSAIAAADAELLESYAQRLAEALEVDVKYVSEAAQSLYGRPVGEEWLARRDARFEEPSSENKSRNVIGGHVTREIKAEIAAELRRLHFGLLRSPALDRWRRAERLKRGRTS